MSYSSEVLADSPAVYWKLDETSGTAAADSSGNGRTATHSGPTVNQASLLGDGSGASCSYDRTNDFTTIASATWMNSSTAVTVEARVQPTSGVLSAGGFIASRWINSSNRHWILGVTNTGKAAAYMWLGGAQFSAIGSTTLTAGTNYTLTHRWSSATNTLSIFVNGVLDGSTSTTGAPTAAPTAALDLGRASAANGSGTSWGGLIDEVSVTMSAVSDARIATRHAAAVAAPVSLTGVTADVQVEAPAGTVQTVTPGPVSLTGVEANIDVAAPAGTVAAPVSLTGPTADVQVEAPAGSVAAGTSGTQVSLTGVTVDVQVDAPAGTVVAGSVGTPVSLTGVTADIQVTAPAGSVYTTEVVESYANASDDIADPFDLEWEQLESFANGSVTAIDTLEVAVDPVTRRPGYSLKVVNMQGDVVCELTEAAIGTSTRTLNGRGGLDFVLPKLSDEVAQVQQFTEVQLWRGGHLVPGGWYVVVDPAIEIDAHVMGFQCSGLSYYFERRLIGDERTELLLNGGFESGARYWNFGWTPGGTSGRAPDHLLTRDACEGGKALRVYGDSNGHRQFAWQGFSYTNTHPTEPLWIDIQAQCRVDDWDGPSKDGWILYADVRPSSGSNTILHNDYTSMDETTPRDRWMGQSVRVKIAANTTSWVQVRLYPPHGSASFDQVSAKADTELLILKRDPWQAIQSLVEEAQDVDHGKSDLNIYTYGSWSGFKIDRRYPWKDGTAVSEAIDEIVRSRNGPDANMEVGARIRRLTVAPKQGARNGRTLVLALGERAGDARIVSYSAGIDGDEVATTARVQSSWSGGGMTEVVRSSPRTDGLVLEKLYQAEQDTPTSTLIQQATTAVKYGRADVITRVVMHPDDTTSLMQQLTIGEVVTLDVHDGEIAVRANYRIVQIELDPNADQYAYTVVPEV